MGERKRVRKGEREKKEREPYIERERWRERVRKID
jgi:hypothetical protein